MVGAPPGHRCRRPRREGRRAAAEGRREGAGWGCGRGGGRLPTGRYTDRAIIGSISVVHRARLCGTRGPVRHRNSEINYWGWPRVGPTIFLWRMCAWCATKTCYFSGAPNLCGARKSGAPQNSLTPLASFLLGQVQVFKNNLPVNTTRRWLPC
jgi:hypothetical protein